MEEFGVRLLSYDLPGFGESDPHPNRNLESSAMDMLLLADAVGINDKFWVVGYSSGSMHAWAALRYIPDRLAGINVSLLYNVSMTTLFSKYCKCLQKKISKEEVKIWAHCTLILQVSSLRRNILQCSLKFMIFMQEVIA